MRALAVGIAQPPLAANPAVPQITPQAPQISQRQNLAPGQIIKDCADCPEMVAIPAGSFQMGSNESANEQPIHRVNVPGFLFGKTEVTQGLWKAVMGSNPSYFSSCGDDCPVESVSWKRRARVCSAAKPEDGQTVSATQRSRVGICGKGWQQRQVELW